MVTRFEDLDTWKRSRILVKQIYDLTKRNEFAKDFVLKDQVRRAVVSISSNIAEGFERGGNKEFIQFLYIAKASAGELRSQIYIALDLNYVNEKEFNILKSDLNKISSMIYNLIISVQETELKGLKFKDAR